MQRTCTSLLSLSDGIEIYSGSTGVWSGMELKGGSIIVGVERMSVSELQTDN